MFQNFIVEEVESRKKRSQNCQTKYMTINNKESLTVLCSVVKQAGSGKSMKEV